MNLRDLRYLVSLSEHKHFGKAAKACFISQPTLSMQLKKLEETLEVQLVERTNKSVLLTGIGERIAQEAQHILHRADELKVMAKLANNPYAGELNIGIIPTLAPYLLPHIIFSLKNEFPHITFYLHELQTATLLERLRDGKLDAALLAFPVSETLETYYEHYFLFKEKFLLAVSKTHRFAEFSVISLSDLENETLLLLEDGHCLRQHALMICQQIGAEENSTFRATSLETLRHMVAISAGITLLPELAYQKNDGIHYIPFKDVQPTRSIGMLWRNTTAKKSVLNDIANQIKSCTPFNTI